MKPLAQYNPFDPAVVENPWDFHRALREEAPVYAVPGLGFFLVSTHAGVLEVVSDPRRFSSKSGPAVGGMLPPPEVMEVMAQGYPQVDTLLTQDPPDHIRYRSLVSRAFSARRVSGLEAYVRQIAEELVSGFVDEGTLDLVPRYAVPLPLSVIADQLGVPRSDMALFKKWSDDAVAPLGGMISLERSVECAHSLVEFQHYIVKTIEERRASPREDILSDLIGARLDGEAPLDVPEMLSILQQFLVAGNETTANLIASATMLLCQNPEQLALVRADLSLIPNMIEEALRLESPVQSLFRIATEDTSVQGVAIPKGARIVVMYTSANRDAAVFPDPDRFDVRRENAKAHLAFGRGEHFCIGAALARKEAAIALETLLGRTRDLRLSRAKNDFAHVPSFILRGLKQLWVDVVPD
jgi:cytochrome P450